MTLRWLPPASGVARIVLLVGAIAQAKEPSCCADQAAESAGPVCRCGGWFVAETRRFWVCCYTETLPAGDIGRHCEALYGRLCRKWMGDRALAGWSPKCSIVLHPNRESYLAAVGRAAEATAGSSLVERHAGRIINRRIDLRGDRPDYLTAALPHELTHVILADDFLGQSLPRWADEGMAILADSDTKRGLHLRDLRLGFANGTVLPVSELFLLQGYPTAERWGVFYGQSASLVQYLVDRGTPRQFVEFLQQVPRSGYDGALQASYGIADRGELDRLWRASMPSLATSSSTSLANMP